MRRKQKSFEENAVQRGPEAERVAVGAAGPGELRYDLSRPGPAPLVAREAAALPMRLDASHSDGYPALFDRVIGELRHLLYGLDEQQQDIVRLRNDTRVALARMGAR